MGLCRGRPNGQAQHRRMAARIDFLHDNHHRPIGLLRHQPGGDIGQARHFLRAQRVEADNAEIAIQQSDTRQCFAVQFSQQTGGTAGQL